MYIYHGWPLYSQIFTKVAWCQASTVKFVRITLSLFITQRVVVISHTCLGTAIGHYPLRNKLEDRSLIYTDWVAKSRLENPSYPFMWSMVLMAVCHLSQSVGICGFLCVPHSSSYVQRHEGDVRTQRSSLKYNSVVLWEVTGKLPPVYYRNTNNFLTIKPIRTDKLYVISTFPSRTCVVCRHGAEGAVLLYILCGCKLPVYNKHHIARNVQHQNTNNLICQAIAA